jgi:hypothetical protein
MGSRVCDTSGDGFPFKRAPGLFFEEATYFRSVNKNAPASAAAPFLDGLFNWSEFQ